MLLKKSYKLGKDLRRDWFIRVRNVECSRICSYYSDPDKCTFYKSGCVWFLKHLPLIYYRYVPKKNVENGNYKWT